MNQLQRIEVEPLSDKRWAKIERSLMARLQLESQHTAFAHGQRPATRFRPWLLAAAALSFLSVLGLVVYRLPDATTLEHPSRITTGTSPSHVALPGLALDVDPQSAVVVSADTPQGILLVLDRGSITCQVAPRPPGSPLVVQAGASRIEVLGTRFSVTRLGEIARVKVYEGLVEITAAGQSQRIGAGEEWPAAEVERPVSDLGPHLEPDSKNSNAAGSTPASSAAPSRTKRLPDAAATRAPRRSNASDRPARQSAAAISSSAAKQGASRQSSQAIFEEATTLERNDPARAAELYRSLESRADSWAPNALYARGRLAASRGNLGEARRLLRRYLERFPRGSNAEDARAVLRRLR